MATYYRDPATNNILLWNLATNKWDIVPPDAWSITSEGEPPIPPGQYWDSVTNQYSNAPGGQTGGGTGGTGTGQPPAAQPPMGQPPAATPPVAAPVGGLGNTEKQFDPFTAYLQQIGVGGKAYRTPAEEYHVRQFEPLKQLYDVYQRFGAPGSAVMGQYSPYGAFTDFTASKKFQDDPFAENRLAENMLNTIFGATPEQRSTFEASYNPFTIPEGQSESGEAETNWNNIRELQNLIGMGARQKFGALGSKYAAGRVGREAQMWRDNQAAMQGTGTQGNFLDYLKTRGYVF